MRNQDIVGEELAKVLPPDQGFWFTVPHLVRLNLILIIPLLSSAVAGYDGSLMNGLQSTSSWKARFGNPSGSRLGLVNASQSIGNLVVLPIVVILSDRIGRRWMLLVGSIFIVVASAIQAASVSYGMFVAARLLVGIGSGLVTLPSPVIISELAYPTHRGKYTGLFWCGFHLGAIIAGWTTYGCQKSLSDDDWAWRTPSLVQAALPLLQIILFPLLPESPRWLVANGRTEQARRILTEYHAGRRPSKSTETSRSNSKFALKTDIKEEQVDDDPSNSALIVFEMAEIATAIRQEKEARDSRWAALIETRGNRRRTAIAVAVGSFAMWNGTTVMSVYLTLVLDIVGITDPDTQTLINGVITIFNLVVSASAATLAVDRLGRRPLFLWSTAGMLISFIIWTACSAVVSDQASSSGTNTTSPTAIAVLVFIFIYSFHYDIAYTPLVFAYPTEIFPYSLRAKGLSIVFACFYGSLIILSFVNPIGLDAIGWRYYLVFCCFLVVMLAVTWVLFPETKGHSLEEMRWVFDGRGKGEGITLEGSALQGGSIMEGRDGGVIGEEMRKGDGYKRREGDGELRNKE